MTQANIYNGHSQLKQTLVLTTLLFLIVVPEPDARDIAKISANFLVSQKQSVLLASSEQNDHVQHQSGR